jgi:hypothetical protein
MFACGESLGRKTKFIFPRTEKAASHCVKSSKRVAANRRRSGLF